MGKEALICTSSDLAKTIEGRLVYEVAAEQLGLEINIERYGKGSEAITIFVRIPEGGRVQELLEKSYELVGGKENFYRKPESQAKQTAQETHTPDRSPPVSKKQLLPTLRDGLFARFKNRIIAL